MTTFRGALQGSAALLAALGAIGLVGGTLLAIWVPELAGFAIATLVGGLLLIAAAAVASSGTVVKTLAGRKGRFSGVGLATIALTVGLAVIVNVIANAAGTSWDLTATRQFEISSQAVSVLKALDTPVEVIGLVVPTSELHARFRATAEQYLEEFAKETDHLRFRFVDPQLEPSVARSYDAVRFPSLIFSIGPDGPRFAIDAEALGEQRLITAILAVTRTQQHAIYFVTGHGERDSNDLRAGSQGYGLAARGLRADGYTVASLNLLREAGVPDDASALVIAAPQGDMTDTEQAIVIDWIADGGRAVLLIEPGGASPGITRSLLATWGLAQVPGTIVDPARSAASDPRTLVVQRDQYRSDSSITQGGVIVGPLGSTLLPGAAAIRPLPDVTARLTEGEPLPVRYGPIASSSRESWVSTNPPGSAFDVSTDEPGPHTLGLVVQASDTIADAPTAEFDPNRAQTRLVVFGDADFASNRHFGDLGNGDLFLNAVNWVLEDQGLIAIRAKTEVFRPLVLTVNEFNLIRYVAWFLLPAAMAVGAVVAWWRRR
jgi:ABC-type uncharacterized transport system involved in gliding motility auxiliary subunit